MFIFRFLEKRFNGQMTLLVVDEAWRFLSHESFMLKMRQWLKELRKKHVFCVFATQEVADAAQSAIAPTLIQNCPTKIYLADPEAENAGEYYRKFGLTDEEIGIISMRHKKRDYYYKSPLGTRLFQLSLGPIALGIMRQQDQMIKDKDGAVWKWGDFCTWLLEKKEADQNYGFVEEILSMQGIKYDHYLTEASNQTEEAG